MSGDPLWKALRILARIIALLWAGFWIFFGIASGLGEGMSAGGIFLHTLMPGLIFLASALAAWKWESYGGKLLIAEGLAILIAYPMTFRRFPVATIVFMLLTMALPPIIAGSLLLVRARTRRTKMVSS